MNIAAMIPASKMSNSVNNLSVWWVNSSVNLANKNEPQECAGENLGCMMATLGCKEIKQVSTCQVNENFLTVIYLYDGEVGEY